MSKEKKTSSLDPTEIAQLANAKPQGKRPEYFSDPMAEKSFSVTMALVAELAVARERIDTLERLLVAKGVLAEDEVDGFVPGEEEGEERQLAQVEYSLRVLRSLQQDVEGMAEKQELSMEQMAERLGEVDPSGNNDA